MDFINDPYKNIEVSSNKGSFSIEYIEDTSKLSKLLQQQSLFTGEIEDSLSKAKPHFLFKFNTDERLILADKISDNRSTSWKRDKVTNIKSNFISAKMTEEIDIARLYGYLVDLNKERFLNESLILFDENLVSLKQKVTNRDGDVVLKIELKDRDRPVLLSSLGDGVNRYIAILCAIWASQDGFLFIDEIENGIHYTNYKKLWEIIFKASKDANCQVFSTTHSKECISAFNELNDSNEGAYFELYKNIKKNTISAHKRDKEQLDYALSHDGRIRGE